MKNHDFKISTSTLWFLAIGNLLFFLFGALAKLQSWYFADVFLLVGLMLFFTTWLIILLDMVKNKIHDKTFWIMSILILPSIASLVYLYRRNQLLKYAD